MSHYLDTLKAGFVNELEKIAFSVTRKGHEFDARRHALLARQSAELDTLAQGYGAQGSSETGRPGLVNALRFGADNMQAGMHRHHQYVAKQHSYGRNAWNPYGGMLTPSVFEEGGTATQLGKVNPKFPTEAATREKIASAREEAEIDAKLGPAWGAFVDAKTPAHKIREALSTLGGGVAGAGLGAGVGALGAMGLRGLGVPVTPGGGARAGGLIGGGLGLGVGGVLGDSHGQSDVDLGRKYERYANLEDKVLGTGAGSARATLHASQAGSAKK